MYFGVPVVAWGRTAVPETLGDAGIVLWEYDDTAFATAIRDIVQDRERAGVIVEAGHRRYERCFQPRVVERRLIAILEEVLAGCGRAQHTKTTAADWS
jgi:glycosyltransferase involved in cell wall biosynthesis